MTMTLSANKHRYVDIYVNHIVTEKTFRHHFPFFQTLPSVDIDGCLSPDTCSHGDLIPITDCTESPLNVSHQGFKDEVSEVDHKVFCCC